MRQKAIIYTRVSTEDQKVNGFSLQEQESRLRRHCDREQIEVVAHYQEDYSAKDFNRPQIMKMLEDIKTKKVKADFLLCVRWDRFTRNLKSYYEMREQLLKLGVHVNTLEGGTKNEDETPDEFLNTGFQVLFAEYDNLKRTDNTKRGMRQARKEGRWMGPPPKGYSRVREIDKSYLVPNEEAEFVRYAFEEFVSGAYSVEELRKKLWMDGFKIKTNGFHKLLRNPAYLGRIKIEAWRDEPEEIVNGLHDAIIDEDHFDRVQVLLEKRKKDFSKVKNNDEHFPLRGLLICSQCGRKLTGSPSRSSSGAKYYYYHCRNGCKERFRADEAGLILSNYLENLNIKPEVVELYKHIMQDIFRKDDAKNDNEKDKLFLQKNEFKTLLEKAEDKFLRDEIDRLTFSNMKERYEERMNQVNAKIFDLQLVKSNYMKYIEYDFSLLKNLKHYFENADVVVKRKIISSMFPENLIFENKKCRTPRMNQVLELLTSKINELGEIKRGKINHFFDLSPEASPRGVEPLLQV